MSEEGIVLINELFMLMIMSRTVRRRPSRPGTTSYLMAKLAKLMRTRRPQGTKYVQTTIKGFLLRMRKKPVLRPFAASVLLEIQ